MDRGDSEIEIDGLAAFLEEARLKDQTATAVSKLKEWGAAEMQEILRDDSDDLLAEFKDHLQLKLLEQRRFDETVKRWKDAMSAGQQPERSPAAALAPGASALVTERDLVPTAAAPVAERNALLPGGHDCIIKNTFIEPRMEHPASGVLARAHTTPAPATSQNEAPDRDCIEECENEDDEDEDGERDSRRHQPETLSRLETTEVWVQYSHDGSLPWAEQQDASSSSDPFTGGGAHMDMAPFGGSQANPMWFGMWPPMAVPPVPMFMPGMGFGPMPMMAPGMEAPYSQSYLERPAPKTSLNVENTSSSKVQVTWIEPAGFLKSKDSHAHVSPEFQLSLGADQSSSSTASLASVNFKILICPKVHSHVKGGASFKKAKGRCYVELQCMDVLPGSAPEITFSLAVGRARKKGPVTHCFRSSSTGRLPSGQAEWDFNPHVEDGTFTVLLDIEPCQKAVRRTESAASGGSSAS